MIKCEKSTREVATPPNPRHGIASVVAVGDRREWELCGNSASQSGGIAFVSFDDVTGSFLNACRPKMIFSPVLARAFDCIDLAVHLHRLGFSGSYRAVSRNLPNPRAIEAEVKAVCPNLDFQILSEN